MTQFDFSQEIIQHYNFSVVHSWVEHINAVPVDMLTKDLMTKPTHSVSTGAHLKPCKRLQQQGYRYGKKPGDIRPFSNLRVEELRTELRARKTHNTDQNKAELQKCSETEFKGVQRVPTLLLPNPTQSLSELLRQV